MKKFALLPALALSFTVVSAQVDDPSMGTETTTEAPAVTPQATLDAVEAAGGLTQLDPTAAVANIDSWIAELEGVPGSDSVSQGLTTLKEQLTASSIDANAVGMTLSSLGAQTTALGEAGTPLAALGEALSSSGAELSGQTQESSAPAGDYSAEPTTGTDAGPEAVTAGATLAAATEAGGLTKLEPSAALSNIESWIGKLDGVEGGEPVIEKLEELKMELGKTPLDASKVGYSLGDLGDLTEALATDNPELQELATALKGAAEELK